MQQKWPAFVFAGLFLGTIMSAGILFEAVDLQNGSPLESVPETKLSSGNSSTSTKDWTSSNHFPNIDTLYSCRNTGTSTIIAGQFEDYSLTFGNFTVYNNYTTRTDVVIASYNDDGTWNWVKSIGGNSSDGIGHKQPKCNSEGDFLIQLTGSGRLEIGNNSYLFYGDDTNLGYRVLVAFDESGYVKWVKNSSIGSYADSNQEFIYAKSNELLYKFDWSGNQIWSRDMFQIEYTCGFDTHNLSTFYLTENESLVFTESCVEGQMSIENQSSSSYDNYSFVDMEEYARFYVVAWNNSGNYSFGWSKRIFSEDVRNLGLEVIGNDIWIWGTYRAYELDLFSISYYNTEAADEYGESFLLKLDLTGNILSQQFYNGTGRHEIKSIFSDHDYMVMHIYVGQQYIINNITLPPRHNFLYINWLLNQTVLLDFGNNNDAMDLTSVSFDNGGNASFTFRDSYGSYQFGNHSVYSNSQSSIIATFAGDVYLNQNTTVVPSITELENWTVSPSAGSSEGGIELTITGKDFYSLMGNYEGSENYNWTNIEVDSSISTSTDMRHSSITIDSSGNPHISYFDGQNGDLKYAKIENGTWKNYTIDSAVSNGGGYVGKYSSIGIDSNGTIHFSYFGGSNGHLKYAHRDIYGQGASYSINYDLNSVQGSHASLDIDDQNRAHIVYYDETDMDIGYVVVSDYGQSWSDNVILDNPSYTEEPTVRINRDNIILQLDSNNMPHLLFVDESDNNNGNGQLIYGLKTNESWNFEIVANAGTYTYSPGFSLDLAIGINDDVHIVYPGPDGVGAYFGYLHKLTETWSKIKFLNNENEGIYLAVDVDSSNNTHIVHYDNFYEHNNQLIHRVYDSNLSNISYSVVNSSEGKFNSLVSDNLGNLHLAYCANGVQKYAFLNFGQTVNNEIEVMFGNYGNVTGTVVNDSTIRVTTPPGLTGDTVDLTIWGDNGSGYVLTSAFSYLSDSDTDDDGIDNELDDCPDFAGNSTIDQIGCPDSDGDGYSDSGDLFPSDSGEWADSDGDGVGNNGDQFPNDSNESQDSDGDGLGDNADVFPNDANETADSDGDGVGDNSDAFPLDVLETLDSDGDGVGDNADAFPNDDNETQDTDGDGIGDNEDEYPFLNNYNDSDGDSFFDIMDDFPEESTQWADYDGDGYGDNPLGNNSDVFINNATQWSDADGDGFGDNWGNPEWNATRLFIWPGQFVDGAELADHCPTEFGNSSANGYFGCPDDDGDGIANMYDDYDDNQIENQTIDSDGDGVNDSEDLCPETAEGIAVDILGCPLNYDTDGDGIEDSMDNCPDSRPGAIINVVGCEIIEEVKEESTPTYTESLMAGDPETVAKTVGMGAVVVAVLGFLQTNFVAAMLPDTVKWLQFMRRKSKLSKEEEQELMYLQSVVQAYFMDRETLSEELIQLKSELTARYTNNEIKKSTREKLNILIKDLQEMDDFEIKQIAHDDTYFGLVGTVDVITRNEILEQDLAMRNVDYDYQESVEEKVITAPRSSAPSGQLVGQINPADNYEYLEHPAGSGVYYIRNQATNQWEIWK